MGDTDPYIEPRERFVLEQTLRGLDRQATVLGELRQRANIVLSASGIIASLLGATALKNGHPRGVVYAALASTAIGIALCVWVLKSVRDGGERRAWRVTLSKDELLGLRAESLSPANALDTLITCRGTNYETIALRSDVFIAACACLPVQIGLWAVVVLW